MLHVLCTIIKISKIFHSQCFSLISPLSINVGIKYKFIIYHVHPRNHLTVNVKLETDICYDTMWLEYIKPTQLKSSWQSVHNEIIYIFQWNLSAYINNQGFVLCNGLWRRADQRSIYIRWGFLYYYRKYDDHIGNITDFLWSPHLRLLYLKPFSSSEVLFKIQPHLFKFQGMNHGHTLNVIFALRI